MAYSISVYYWYSESTLKFKSFIGMKQKRISALQLQFKPIKCQTL